MYYQPLETVRELVGSTFREQGVDQEAIVEKILIRDGFYCGRSFVCEGYRAVWFIEENSVKFYRSDGEFLTSLAVDQPAGQRERRVA